MSTKRKQEPIGFNEEEKKLISRAVKIENQKAKDGDKKTSFSSFVRDAAVERAKLIINLNINKG